MTQFNNIKVIELCTPEELELAYHVRREVYVREYGYVEKTVKDEYDDESDIWAAVGDITDEKGNIKNNVPLGTIRLYPLPDKVARLGRIAVISDARRQGIGKKLVLSFIENAKRKGYDSIVVHGFSSKRDFYQKLGFNIEEGDADEFIENGPPLVKLWMRQLQNI
ncbi:acyl-CoA N-acyltransferase [Backusella circina FSU 941]|nr:acyl-CoA N-acyltransferase [Backusella circina FSU 941]